MARAQGDTALGYGKSSRLVIIPCLPIKTRRGVLIIAQGKRGGAEGDARRPG